MIWFTVALVSSSQLFLTQLTSTQYVEISECPNLTALTSFFKGSDMPTKLPRYQGTRYFYCHHQWLVWVPVSDVVLETVGLWTKPVSDQKKSLLVLQVWCCVVKHCLVMLVIIMILDTATFQVLFIVSLFCAWNITTVEISKWCLLT